MSKNRTPYHPNLREHLRRGLDLRDHFAAQALPVAIQVINAGSEENESTADLVQQTAVLAYMYADAMMAERERDD